MGVQARLRVWSLLVVVGVCGALVAALPSGTVSAQSPNGFAVGQMVVVASDRLKYRSGPGLSAEVGTGLGGGTVVWIGSPPTAADGYTWYAADGNDVSGGWVAGELLAAIDDSPFGIGDAVRVYDGRLNFRADPGLGTTVINVLEADTLLAVIDGPIAADGYTWYRVFNYYYGPGWAAGEFLRYDPNGFPWEDLDP